MSDKTIFGCAETGTYQTSAPNPHIELSGTASTAYSIAQLFADAMSTDETATVSVVKDKDNWAVYGGAKFTNSTPDTLDLSVGTLLDSKGTLSDEDAVTCLGLAPGSRGVFALRVYRSAALNSPNNTWGKLALDVVQYDTGGMWDAANTRAIPKIAGYYLATARLRTDTTGNVLAAIGKNGSQTQVLGADAAGAFASGGTGLIYCNGTTDYLEAWVYTSTARAVTLGAADTYMEIIGPLAA